MALVAVAGSIFGWAAMHLVTPPVDRRLAIIGVVSALGVGTVGVYGFQAQPQPQPQPPSSAKQAAAQPQITRFIDPEKLAVENPVDDNKPQIVSDVKPTQMAGTVPYASLEPSEIVNRGKPVVVAISGTGASSYSLVSFDMNRSNGSSCFSDSTHAAEDGTYGFHFVWSPDASLGVAGNNGGWPVVIMDRYSGQKTVVQLNISSDADTPPATRWALAGLNVQTGLAFKADMTTSGSMCTDGHAVSLLSVHGATAGGSLAAYYLNARGEEVAEVFTSADALGELAEYPLFWEAQNCKHGLRFLYTVIVIDSATGNQAKANFLLETPD